MKPEFSLLELFRFFLISISVVVVYKNRYINRMRGIKFFKIGIIFLWISYLFTNLESFFLPVFFNRIEHLFIGIGGIFLILLTLKNIK